MSLLEVAHVARMRIEHKMSMSNSYRVVCTDTEYGAEATMAEADQTIMTLKNEIIFRGEEKFGSQGFRLKANSVWDGAGTVYDIADDQERPLGHIRKEFSLMRPSFTLEGMDIQASGQAKGFFAKKIDFTTSSGDPTLRIESQMGFRTRYDVEVPLMRDGQRLDWRIAAAMTTCYDMLERQNAAAGSA